ncbi:MAG: ACT domain-containing protein [Clostridia bacterium]|nr:ACT domain-containing protein [Clostridia bacterium]
MKAVIAVIGKDYVGIIAKVSAVCAECGANIVDISQSVLKEYFTMSMLVDIDGLKMEFTAFVDRMNTLSKEIGMEIHTMHENIFNAMHNI